MTEFRVWGGSFFVVVFVVIVCAVMAIRYYQVKAKRSRANFKTKAGQLDSILNAAVDCIITSDERGAIQSVNRATEVLFGYRASELIGQNISLLMPDHYARLHDQCVESYQGGAMPKAIGLGREVYAKRKDGNEFPVRIVLGVMKTSQGNLYTGFISDVSERKRYEDKLLNREQMLARLLEGVDDNILVFANDGSIALANSSALSELDLPVNKVISKPTFEVFSRNEAEFHLNCVNEVVETHCTLTQQRPRGERIFEYKYSPILDGDGSVHQIAVVARNITQHIRGNEALAQAKEKAETASKAKSEFLSRMNHELRTPLNAILGFSQAMLMDEEVLSDEQRESVGYIHSAGKHLLELVNESLDLANVESGLMEFKIKAVDTALLINESLGICRSFAEQKNIKLTHSIDFSDVPNISADYLRIKQVLLNLLTNAIKYNHAGGVVTIKLRVLAGGRVRIMVSDTGFGIPSHLMDQLFVQFERLGAEKTTIEGAGIGLALSKQLVENMGGRVGVISREGKGSTFWLELPNAGASVPREMVSVLTPDYRYQSSIRQIAVLCIEDSPVVVRLLESVIHEYEGVSLISVHDLESGLKVLGSIAPQVVFLDVNLSFGTGPSEAFLQNIKHKAISMGIPVIGLETIHHGIVPEDNKYRDCTSVLSKPINTTKLKGALLSVMNLVGEAEVG